MHKILRRYLDLEADLDRVAREAGGANFKELTIAPTVDVLKKVTEIITSYGMSETDLLNKFAELRGENAGTTLYLLDGTILATHKLIQGEDILLAAAHLLRAA